MVMLELSSLVLAIPSGVHLRYTDLLRVPEPRIGLAGLECRYLIKVRGVEKYDRMTETCFH